MKQMMFAAGVIVCMAQPLWSGQRALSVEEERAGWVSIFDGKSMDGWHISKSCGHGSGEGWAARDGALQGTQDKPGNGGIVLTDQVYGDFEVALEMANDYGPDSGLFLRSDEQGRCYQALIDYHADGNLMGIYGEGIGAFSARNFNMLAAPDRIDIMDHPPFPCPFTPESWKKHWKPGWNELRARITGNPPFIETWINGVQTIAWQGEEKLLPDTGRIGLQVHGGGNLVGQFVRYRNIRVREISAPNTLSEQEKKLGYQLLFDGKTLNGWKTEAGQESKRPVDDHAINPHGCGGCLMVYEKPQQDFVLALEFKISKGCNSGIFLRTSPLTSLPGWDVGYNGIEVAIDDTQGVTMHDTGAIYDLVAATRNAMKPAGQWNQVLIMCEGQRMAVSINGDWVSHIDLDRWIEASKRPDGTTHKFRDKVFKNHPRSGYIGLQDHGSPCWFRNIKLLPLGGK